MGHVAREKTKLLNRVKRMRGQLEAIGARRRCGRRVRHGAAAGDRLSGCARRLIAEVIKDQFASI